MLEKYHKLQPYLKVALQTSGGSVYRNTEPISDIFKYRHRPTTIADRLGTAVTKQVGSKLHQELYKSTFTYLLTSA